jgi:hypothetical protein
MEDISEDEALLLKSFDAAISDSERKKLTDATQNDFALRRNNSQYLKIRELLKRDVKATFGPFFEERIVHVIKSRKENLDFLVLSFFKKYQLIVLGILVALFVLNLVFTKELTFASLFGLEPEPMEDIYSVDAYKNLPK